MTRLAQPYRITWPIDAAMAANIDEMFQTLFDDLFNGQATFGLSTFVNGDVIYATSTSTLGRLADVATGQVLLSGGVGIAPNYGQVSLAGAVSGILPIANGGTNVGVQSGDSIVYGILYFDSTKITSNNVALAAIDSGLGISAIRIGRARNESKLQLTDSLGDGISVAIMDASDSLLLRNPAGAFYAGTNVGGGDVHIQWHGTNVIDITSASLITCPGLTISGTTPTFTLTETGDPFSWSFKTATGGVLSIVTSTPFTALTIDSSGNSTFFNPTLAISPATADAQLRLNASGGGGTDYYIQNIAASGDFRVRDNTLGKNLLVLTYSSGDCQLLGKIGTYKNVATTGWGVPAIYGTGRSVAAIAAVASVATYTMGAADGSVVVSANVNVTVSTAHSFTVTVTYTDETNTVRTLTLPFSQLTGAIITAITNVTGAGAYEGLRLHLRCKASTAITVATVGTFTTVTYNVEGNITQIA